MFAGIVVFACAEKQFVYVRVSAGHRRRSNTAQRLEKLKREKHKQSKIKHIQWKEVEHPVDEIGKFLLISWQP